MVVIIILVTLILQLVGWIDIMTNLTDIWIWVVSIISGVAFGLIVGSRKQSKNGHQELSKLPLRMYTSKELPLDDFLRKAKLHIYISGFSSETIPRSKPSLIKKLIEENNVHVTFLLLNPKSELVKRVEEAFDLTTMESTITSSLIELQRIKKSLSHDKQTKLEIKIYDLLPFNTMIVIDPDSEKGEMQIGCLLYYTDSMSRPLFTISKAEDKGNFEKYWNSYRHALDNAVEYS